MAKPELTERDWIEIYYALDSKARAIEEGTYDSNREEQKDSFEWSVHLREIMGAIGPDGSSMYPEATPQGPAESMKIIMRLEGGLIQGVENIPEGIVVEVRDYDIEGMSDEEMAEECEKDEEGEWFIPRRFDKTDCPEPEKPINGSLCPLCGRRSAAHNNDGSCVKEGVYDDLAIA